MTWEIGQVVAELPYEHFSRPQPVIRRTVAKLYKDGGCATDNGKRWLDDGKEHGAASRWYKARIVPWKSPLHDDLMVARQRYEAALAATDAITKALPTATLEQLHAALRALTEPQS